MSLNNDKYELIIFDNNNGGVELRFDKETENIWATDKQMAGLFWCTDKNILLHISNIDKDWEVGKSESSKDFLLNWIRQDNADYVNHYNLDMILSVWYRVNSKRAVGFRKWANRILKDYLLRWGAINENLTTAQEQGLYQKLRALRTNEKNLYVTVRDVFKESSEILIHFTEKKTKKLEKN